MQPQEHVGEFTTPSTPGDQISRRIQGRNVARPGVTDRSAAEQTARRLSHFGVGDHRFAESVRGRWLVSQPFAGQAGDLPYVQGKFVADDTEISPQAMAPRSKAEDEGHKVAAGRYIATLSPGQITNQRLGQAVSKVSEPTTNAEARTSSPPPAGNNGPGGQGQDALQQDSTIIHAARDPGATAEPDASIGRVQHDGATAPAQPAETPAQPIAAAARQSNASHAEQQVPSQSGRSDDLVRGSSADAITMPVEAPDEPVPNATSALTSGGAPLYRAAGDEVGRVSTGNGMQTGEPGASLPVVRVQRQSTERSSSLPSPGVRTRRILPPVSTTPVSGTGGPDLVVTGVEISSTAQAVPTVSAAGASGQAQPRHETRVDAPSRTSDRLPTSAPVERARSNAAVPQPPIAPLEPASHQPGAAAERIATRAVRWGTPILQRRIGAQGPTPTADAARTSPMQPQPAMPGTTAPGPLGPVHTSTMQPQETPLRTPTKEMSVTPLRRSLSTAQDLPGSGAEQDLAVRTMQESAHPDQPLAASMPTSRLVMAIEPALRSASSAADLPPDGPGQLPGVTTAGVNAAPAEVSTAQAAGQAPGYVPALVLANAATGRNRVAAQSEPIRGSTAIQAMPTPMGIEQKTSASATPANAAAERNRVAAQSEPIRRSTAIQAMPTPVGMDENPSTSAVPASAATERNRVAVQSESIRRSTAIQAMPTPVGMDENPSASAVPASAIEAHVRRAARSAESHAAAPIGGDTPADVGEGVESPTAHEQGAARGATEPGPWRAIQGSPAVTGAGESRTAIQSEDGYALPRQRLPERLPAGDGDVIPHTRDAVVGVRAARIGEPRNLLAPAGGSSGAGQHGALPFVAASSAAISHTSGIALPVQGKPVVVAQPVRRKVAVQPAQGQPEMPRDLLRELPLVTTGIPTGASAQLDGEPPLSNDTVRRMGGGTAGVTAHGGPFKRQANTLQSLAVPAPAAVPVSSPADSHALVLQRQTSAGSATPAASGGPAASASSPPPPPPAAPAPGAQRSMLDELELERVATAVYGIIRDRLIVERENRGL